MKCEWGAVPNVSDRSTTHMLDEYCNWEHTTLTSEVWNAGHHFHRELRRHYLQRDIQNQWRMCAIEHGSLTGGQHF